MKLSKINLMVMKKSVFLFVFIFSFVACSSQDEEQQKIPPKMEPNSEWHNLLLGRWEIVEKCETDISGKEYSCIVPSVHHYDFISDSIVKTDKFIGDCKEGIYNLDYDTLHFEFPCSTFNLEIYFLNENKLILKLIGIDTEIFLIYQKKIDYKTD